MKQEALNTASRHDHDLVWKQIRKAGTTLLFEKDPKYIDWRSRQSSSTLLYTGKLGAGKSVTLANVVDYAYLQMQNQDEIVIFFFCRHDIAESLTSRTIIGCVARQLLERLPAQMFPADSAVQLTQEDRLVHFVFKNLDSLKLKKTVLVLDGLDDCEIDDRQRVLNFVRGMQEKILLLMCMSSRQDADGHCYQNLLELAMPLVTAMPAENPDIATFVKTELAGYIHSGKMILRNPENEELICRSLVEKSEGMFLWVILQLKTLCFMKSDYKIKQALHDLPRGLPETYCRILTICGQHDAGMQKLILEITVAALKPLDIEQLQEAVSVIPGDTDWDPEKLVTNILTLLDCCGGILVIDEETLEVHLVHYSARQYLLSPQANKNRQGIDIDLAQICLTYLNYEILDSQLVNTKASAQSSITLANAGNIPRDLLESRVLPGRALRQFVMRFFKKTTPVRHQMKGAIPFPISKVEHEQQSRFRFHTYAAEYWFQHFALIMDEDKLAIKLAESIIDRPTTNIRCPGKDDKNVLSWALRKHHLAAVQLLLKSRNCAHLRYEVDFAIAEDLMLDAIARNDILLGTLLIEMSRSSFEFRLVEGHGQLRTKIRSASPEMKELFQQKGFLMTPKTLLSASLEGDAKALRRFLAQGYSIDVRDSLNRTPLAIGAMYGHTEVVRLLLQHRHINTRPLDDELRTPAQIAKFYHHDEIADMIEDLEIERDLQRYIFSE